MKRKVSPVHKYPLENSVRGAEMVDAEQLRKHLRLDDDIEDDTLDTLLIEVADYIHRVTGFKNDRNSPPTYDVAVKLLAHHWYSVRSGVTDTKMHETPIAFRNVMATLRRGKGPVTS